MRGAEHAEQCPRQMDIIMIYDDHGVISFFYVPRIKTTIPDNKINCKCAMEVDSLFYLCMWYYRKALAAAHLQTIKEFITLPRNFQEHICTLPIKREEVCTRFSAGQPKEYSMGALRDTSYRQSWNYATCPLPLRVYAQPIKVYIYNIVTSTWGLSLTPPWKHHNNTHRKLGFESFVIHDKPVGVPNGQFSYNYLDINPSLVEDGEYKRVYRIARYSGQLVLKFQHGRWHVEQLSFGITDHYSGAMTNTLLDYAIRNESLEPPEVTFRSSLYSGNAEMLELFSQFEMTSCATCDQPSKT